MSFYLFKSFSTTYIYPSLAFCPNKLITAFIFDSCLYVMKKMFSNLFTKKWLAGGVGQKGESKLAQKGLHAALILV